MCSLRERKDANEDQDEDQNENNDNDNEEATTAMKKNLFLVNRWEETMGRQTGMLVAGGWSDI
jgi:hypothetical protein